MELKNPLYIIAGPTAVGKGTLVDALKKKHNDIWVSISATTRPPRKYERDGAHYIFLSKNEFNSKIKRGEFLEFAKVHDNYYGTLYETVNQQLKNNKKVILEIDVQGAFQVQQKIGAQARLIFILPPSEPELLYRLKKRGTETTADKKKRLATAKHELEQASKFDYQIINDSLDKTVEKLEEILY